MIFPFHLGWFWDSMLVFGGFNPNLLPPLFISGLYNPCNPSHWSHHFQLFTSELLEDVFFSSIYQISPPERPWTQNIRVSCTPSKPETARPSKSDGWKTTFSFWKGPLFRGMFSNFLVPPSLNKALLNPFFLVGEYLSSFLPDVGWKTPTNFLWPPAHP